MRDTAPDAARLSTFPTRRGSPSTTLFAASAALICSVTVVLVPGVTAATVGGPQLVEQILYDTDTGHVYWKEEHRNPSGHTLLQRYVPDTGETDTEVETGTSEMGLDQQTIEERDEQIEEIITGKEPVPRIDLDENGFELDVELREEPDADYRAVWMQPQAIGVPYRARLTREDEEVGEFEFTGCDPSQRVVLDGFHTPESETLLLRFSTTTQCYEHTYITETIMPVENVELTATTEIQRRDLSEINMTQLPQPTDGSLSDQTDYDTEHIEEHFREMSEEAAEQNEHEAAADYLLALWHHEPRQTDVELEESELFEVIELYVEAGELDSHPSYRGAMFTARTLLEETDGDIQQRYARQLTEDDQFEPLREESEFAELMEEHGFGELLDERGQDENEEFDGADDSDDEGDADGRDGDD